jgi:hypothetical protein
MAAFQVAMACVVSIRGKARLETRLQPHHVPGAGSPGFFRAFPRMDPDALSAFEGWGGPSRILGAMGSTGIGTRAHMRQKRQKPVKLD